MTDLISYTMAMNVSCIWDSLKRKHKNYEEVLGAVVFRRLFEAKPSMKSFFDFGKAGGNEFTLHPNFNAHATMIIDMVDCVVAFLGPDIDALSEHLLAIGHRHVSYGVSKEGIEAMASAIIGALGEVMGDEITDGDSNDWEVIFGIVSNTMIEGMKSAK